MKTVNLRRFSDPDALKELAPTRLHELLDPHRGFFEGKGLNIAPLGSCAEFDYPALATLFTSPDDIPPELVEQFDMIRQLGSPNGLDHIVEGLRARSIVITFDPDSSPVDVAAQLLLRDRRLFNELHAEQAVSRFRSFTYFVSRQRVEGFQPPEDLSPLEAELNDFYEQHHRGRTARVFYREKDGHFWYYIRHAEPIKREGSVELRGNASGCTIYRPERHDLVIYDSVRCELAVHGDSRYEPEVFRRAFGRHLFRDPDFFPTTTKKYTLEPLKTAQRAALVSAGIPGIEAITLVEVELATPGALWVRERYQAQDVFGVFERRGYSIPMTLEVRKAKFLVHFTDSKRPRTLTISPSNHAQFGRDDDAVVLAPWLQRQGFVHPAEHSEPNSNGTLESA